MDGEKLAFYKNLLLKEREAILKGLVDDSESSKSLLEHDSNNVNDSVDDASSTVAQTLLNVMNSKNKQSLTLIESALRRVEDSSFGKCMSCGCDITESRLNSLPWVTQCIDCKTKAEKKR